MGSKMTIAVFLHSSLTSGGGFQYEVKIASLLKSHFKEYNVKFFTIMSTIINDYEECGINIISIEKEDLEYKLLNIYNIELVYFLSPSTLCEKLINIPYIITIWDLCHRDHMEFPEVRYNNEFEKREKFYYSHALKKAIAIIVDDKLTKKNLISRYNIDKKRIHLLKFLPRIDLFDKISIDVKTKYTIKNDYIYYPAQFWAHKNHIYILDALKILKEKYYLIIDVVFTGKDYGNLTYILNTAETYNIKKQVHYLGFVDNKEVPSLYKNSMALVMPTYFGPTNIPPLEAFSYSTPVCYSDLKGLRNQVKDAAFLMDLNNPISLVKTLLKLKNTPKIKEEKLIKGKMILNSWSDDDFAYNLSSIFKDFLYKRKRWGKDLIKKKENIKKKNELSLLSIFHCISEIIYKENDTKFVIYGYGTIGKIIYSFIHQNVIAFVDKESTLISKEIKKGEIYNPTNLSNITFDKIIIGINYDEEKILNYLINELNIDKNKIITIEL